MIKYLCVFGFLITAPWLMGQSAVEQPISLEEIWKEYAFTANRVPGFNFQKDGVHYTRREGTKINQYDLRKGAFTKTLFAAETIGENTDFQGTFDSYSFSDDESKMLLEAQSERIYRYSSKAKFYVWDGKRLNSVWDDGKIMYATFNPQADKVAFVFENNLYVKDLKAQKTTQITDDGAINSIINGALDWVYEEEFSFARGFQWNATGDKIAYYRFDESQVPEFTFANYRDDLYPEYVTFKYPKVGATNSTVDIFVYDLAKAESLQLPLASENDQYIPRIKWTLDPNTLFVTRLNRLQNHLELLAANATTGKITTVLEEKNKYYVDIHDNLTFLPEGNHFLWTSEQDGWNHLYRYTMDGKMDAQLTSGNWEVSEFYGYDEAKNEVFFKAAKKSALNTEIYRMQLDGRNPKIEELSPKTGSNSAQFSGNYDYFVNTYSTINSPAEITVYTRAGKKVRTIEDNADLKATIKERGMQPVEFFDFTTSQNVKLNGWMIKPANFDATKKYPVFMYLYGGPGSQQVMDAWKGQNYWWFQMLAQQGYLVACVDNRGTGGRGEEFKKMTYLQLGKYETEDQIEAAKYLGNLDYTDKNRIGIFGWSYGGYMSSLCLLKGNDVFKAAIAVAPVTNWKWYDSIYTERYMQTEKENAAGYQENSPVYFADRLRGNYLLMHGMGDDNVHFQHAAEMANQLIKNNKQFDTYYYPNRNHSIYGGLTRLHLYQKMTDFLDEKLKGDMRDLEDL